MDPPPPCLSRLAGRVLNGNIKFLPSSCQYSLLVRRGNPSLPPRWPPHSRHRALPELFGGSCWVYLGLLDRIFRLLGLLVCHPLLIFLLSPLQEPLRTDFLPKSTPTCLQLEGFSEVKRCQDSSKMPSKRSFLKILRMYRNYYKTISFCYFEPSKMTQKSMKNRRRRHPKSISRETFRCVPSGEAKNRQHDPNKLQLGGLRGGSWAPRSPQDPSKSRPRPLQDRSWKALLLDFFIKIYPRRPKTPQDLSKRVPGPLPDAENLRFRMNLGIDFG